jgi:hypothetical protein
MISARLGIVLAGAAAVVVGGAVWLTTGGGHKTALPPAVPANPAPVSVGSRQCPAIKGPRWVYPANVKLSSNTYEVFTVGFDCATATSYIKRIVGTKAPADATYREQPLAGIQGFACTAYPDKNGHAYGGSCRHGATEFGWNLNVLYQTPALEGGDDDVADNTNASSVLRPLGHGRYELEIQNTSRIGFINSFRWVPPPKLTITAITSSSRGTCKVDSSGSIACVATLPPPKCLCRPSGGTVTVDFTTPPAEVLKIQGYTINSGTLGARFEVVAMTAVPYLIASTLEQERQGHL